MDHNKLWKILKEMGIPDHLTFLLRNLYAGQEATVRTGHGKTDWFQTAKGVCQGCMLSSCCEVAQLCLTLCHPMDCSLPVFSVHGIFQARILEWVAISFSRGSSWPGIESRSPALQADTLPSEPKRLPILQSTSCELLGWMKFKLESRLPGEISMTSDIQMTPYLWQKAKN